MGLDLDKIRAKVAQLSGQGKKDLKPSKILSLDIGEHVLRALPWKDNDGQPFKERWFYYNIGKAMLAPNQFQKPDPVQDLINKCRASGTQEDKELAKKLYPRMRAYIPVVVRGRESEGVFLWGCGKTVYQRVLGFFLDADVGDVTDLKEGRDLKVKVSQAKGKDFKDTAVDPAFKCTKAGSDKEIKDWLDNIPSLDEIYQLKSTEEVKRAVETWLNSGAGTDQGVGTEKIAGTDVDELEKLASEVTVPSKRSSSKAEKTSAIDDAFADLLDK